MRSPEVPQYSFTNIGAQKIQPDVSMPTLMSPQQPQLSQMDVGTATIASQSSMSGGKIQYTPAQPATTQIPSVSLTPQLIQLLASSGLLTAQQPNQSNPVLQQQQQQQQHVPQTFQDGGMQQMQTDQQAPNPQLELLKQFMQTIASQQQGQAAQGVTNPVITNNDPNMQPQNQEMTSLSSLDQNLLQSFLQGESPMVSFESFEGLSGNIADLNYDPNIAGFETVGGDSNSQNSQQQQYDETSAAVQNLNG